jgi:hypothetical protein
MLSMTRPQWVCTDTSLLNTLPGDKVKPAKLLNRHPLWKHVVYRLALVAIALVFLALALLFYLLERLLGPLMPPVAGLAVVGMCAPRERPSYRAFAAMVVRSVFA